MSTDVRLEKALKRALESGELKITYPPEWDQVAAKYHGLWRQGQVQEPLDLGRLQEIVFGLKPTQDGIYYYLSFDGEAVPSEIGVSPLALAAFLLQIRPLVSAFDTLPTAALELFAIDEAWQIAREKTFGDVRQLAEQAESQLRASGWALEDETLKQPSGGRPRLHLHRRIEELWDHLTTLRGHKKRRSQEIQGDVATILRPFYLEATEFLVGQVVDTYETRKARACD